jgi:hypothetical protein
MNYCKKIQQHFITVCKHKYFVFLNCNKAGIPVQGILHDLSKFSPIEFFESAKYFKGNSSPIDACKKAEGVSKAWLHHKGHNAHHYEYWQDSFDHGGKPLAMPFKYALELICDYLAAGRAYNGDDFTYDQVYNWWKNKCKNPIPMHPQTKLFVELMLLNMKNNDSNDCLEKNKAKQIYKLSEKLIEQKIII